MRDGNYLLTRFCKPCKKSTKQLVKEVSELKFKEFTKSDYIAWCEICSHGSFVVKDEYNELKYTKEIATKAGGILWKAYNSFKYETGT